MKEEDKAELQTCYGRFAVQTHGMMSRSTHYWDNLFSEPGLQTVGSKKNGHILGYAVFTFQPGPAGHFLNNELLVRELVYESKEALAELLTFLYTQADQIEHIIFNIQDDDFHYLLSDPRREGERMLVPTLYHESNIQGLGLMYRVIDVPRLFELLQNHDFNGQTCRLKLTIDDPFLPENSGSWVISFENGRSRIAAGDQYDVAIKIGVAEFSSLVMGTVSCHRLAAYGQAAVSDKTYLNTIDRLFQVPQKPVCMTIF